MKSLRLFVCILMTTLMLFGTTVTPQKVHAQSTVTTVSKSDLQAKGTQLFASIISDLEQKQKDPATALKISNPTEKQKADYVIGNQALIEVVKSAQNTFVTLLNKPATNSTNPYGDFTAALLAASQAITTGTQNPIIRNVPPLRNEGMSQPATTIVAKINTLSQERQQELINSGKAGEAAAIQNSAAAQRAEQARTATEQECSLLHPLTCLDQIFAWFIKTFLLNIAGFLLWLTANMFNYSIVVGVLNFAKWAPDTLYPIWLVVRQILSLIIVFVGLYLGFLYIIGDEKGRFARYMPWVITFALFVNFSYPLARTAIDVSNILTLKIYTSAIGSGTLTSDTSRSDTAGAIIVSRLGLQGLIASSKDTTQSTTLNMIKGLNTTPAALMAVAFVLYAAYIFFMVTALMVIRTAAFVFMIIVSPLLMVDSVLPMLGDKAKDLRKIFLDQLIVGPVFMIMLALTLKFLEVFSGTSATTLTGATGADSVSTFFNLLLMLVMLHIMLKVTKSISGQLGTFATDSIGKVGGLGLGLATGGAALAGRKAIGGMAMKARESGWVKNNQDSFMGRKAYDMSNSLAKSTFDLRNSKVIAGGMERAGFGKGLLGMGGMGGGSGSKIGAEAESEARTKDIAERSTRIKTRYERDVYEKDNLGRIKYDANGVAIVAHKKGDVNEAGDSAKRRYLQNNGGARFLTKQEKERLDDSLTKDYTDTNKKIESEVESSSKEDLAKYASKTDEEKVRFIDGLKKELEEARKTDKDGVGNTAKSITRTLETIEKSRKNGDIQKEALQKYKDFDDTPEDMKAKQEFFDKQTKETQASLLKYDQGIANEENKKMTKEAADKKYREDTLQVQKDLVKAQNDSAEAQRKLADTIAGRSSSGTQQGSGIDVDLTSPAANNPSYTGTTTSTVPLKSLIVDQNGNHFDLDAQGNPIAPKANNEQAAVLTDVLGGDRQAARAARARRAEGKTPVAA